MKRRNKFIDYLAYLAVRLVWVVLSIFPIDATLRAMRSLGRIWYALPGALPELRIPRWFGRVAFLRWTFKAAAGSNKLLLRFREHRARAERHVRMAFPDADEQQVARIVRGSMEQLVMLAVEVLRAPHLLNQWSWARHVKLRKLDGAIRVLLRDKGCIMLTGHYGNWEVLGYTLAILGFDIVAVMRPLDNEYLNRFLLDRRERSGLALLYKKGATRSAPEVLESGGSLCFIADQNAGRKGLFVDFFGYKASTYKSIGLLAMEYEVPIVVGCARRIGRGFEYEICVNRIIMPSDWQGQADELTWITTEFSQAIEAFVRVAPEQYLWIHRRWKSRPRGEKSEDAPPL
ncbi:MAG: lysophospholipid acyltransferase family protein [Planctomycetota bacterium]